MLKNTKTKDCFTKAIMFADFVKNQIGEVSGDELLTILCHLHHHYRHRRNEPLTEKEMLVYDLMLREGLNPHTVYSWFLAAKAPSDVEQRLKEGKISIQQAQKLGRNEVLKEQARKGIEFLRDCRNLAMEVLK